VVGCGAVWMCDRELKEVLTATGPARSFARLAPARRDRLPKRQNAGCTQTVPVVAGNEGDRYCPVGDDRLRLSCAR